MRRTTRVMLAALAAWSAVAGTALAVPATPEEAQRLTALFERFIGHPAGQRGAVSVTPHGESYTAALDISRLFGFLDVAGVSLTAGALSAELTPQADGKWHVAVDGFPPIGVTHDDQASSFVLDGYTLDGLFDPAIRFFASATSTTTGSTSRATGKDGPLDIKLTDTGKTVTEAHDAGEGTVDIKSVSALKDVSYTLSAVPDAAKPSAVGPAAGVATKVTIASLDTTISAAREPIVALEDLWQFLVAHPSKAALVENQAELKTRLKALIPLSTAASADIKVTKVAVATPLGDFGLDSLSQHYDDGGAQGRGDLSVRIAASGLSLPPGLAPSWSVPFLPTSIDLGQSYGPVDLKTGVTLAIDTFDLSADKPYTDEQQAAILEAFSGTGKTLTIAPSTIALPTLTLKFDGQVQLVKPLPTGSGTFAATGLDKTLDAVRAVAADNEAAGQAIAVLLAAKALGKAEGPDAYSWRIAAAAAGR